MAGHPRLPPQKRGKKKKFLQNPHSVFVARQLDNDAGLTLKELVKRCKTQFGITFSRSTVSRAITEFYYSFKRTDVRAERSETAQCIHEREVYAEQFHMMFHGNEASFFFVDEVGFSISMRRPYGYAPRGQPAVVTTPAICSRNFTVMAMIGMPRGDPLEKVMITKVLPTAANTEQCYSFMVEALEALRSHGINYGTIVLDNVPFHHSRLVTDLFPPGGPFTLLFLPPYSHFFNPIENVFGVWKNMVCDAKARNEEELMHVIASTSAQISAETIMNCIIHADTNCEKYASGNHLIS